MRRAATLLIVFLAAAAGRASAQQAIFLVRHAERADASADSPLSETGRARAERLASMLKDAGLTRIYTSDLKRAIDTAAPLATALHLTATALPGGDIGGLIERLHTAGARDRVLVVGHSNTVPAVLVALGVTPPIVIPDAEYDNLFIVFPRASGPPELVRLRF